METGHVLNLHKGHTQFTYYKCNSFHSLIYRHCADSARVHIIWVKFSLFSISTRLDSNELPSCMIEIQEHRPGLSNSEQVFMLLGQGSRWYQRESAVLWEIWSIPWKIKEKGATYGEYENDLLLFWPLAFPASFIMCITKTPASIISFKHE